MKKHLIIYLLLGVSILSSCRKDFLDEEQKSKYTPEALKDSLGFEASEIGLYNHLSTYFTWSDQQGWLSVWQVGTDVANATANQQGIEIPYYRYQLLTPQDGAASHMWNRNYIMINLANTIIASASDASITTITDAGKKRFAAEARFFRAYAYNNLAILFGGVPIITEPLTRPKTDFVRAPLADVNKLIEEDLLFAVTNLPDIIDVPKDAKNQSKFARANKFMAMQLLGEAYLRMDKAALAEAQLQGIISSNRFSLIKSRYGVKQSLPGDYYSDMFVYGNQRRSQGNTEAIWVLEQENRTSVVGGMTGDPQHRRVWTAQYYDVPGMALADSLGGRGLARLRLSNWVLYGLYAKNDVRNSPYNIRREFYYNSTDPKYASLFGKKVPFTGPDTLHKIAPHTTKWNQFDPNDTFGYSTVKDFILMRLGETYLLLAEAQFKQGKTQEAANSINELRKRAFPDYPASGKVEASDITLNFILDERARELVGEENRRMTLMRTKTLVERANRLNKNDPNKPIENLTAKYELLPIPLSEIQLNKDAKLEQNPGYE